METYKEYHGLTLEEVARITGPNYTGYAVFFIPANHPDNIMGNLVDEDYTVALILSRHPELAGCVVKHTNDFYGQIVLRVAEPAEG